jgi:hypothetical protein
MEKDGGEILIRIIFCHFLMESVKLEKEFAVLVYEIGVSAVHVHACH